MRPGGSVETHVYMGRSGEEHVSQSWSVRPPYPPSTVQGSYRDVGMRTEVASFQRKFVLSGLHEQVLSSSMNMAMTISTSVFARAPPVAHYRSHTSSMRVAASRSARVRG